MMHVGFAILLVLLFEVCPKKSLCSTKRVIALKSSWSVNNSKYVICFRVNKTCSFSQAKAIVTTQAAIEKEESRLRAANQVDEVFTPKRQPEISPPLNLAELADGTISERQVVSLQSESTPPLSALGAVTPDSRLRRHSSVTLSTSLKGTRHEPPFPLKLGLSSVPMQLDGDVIPGLFIPSTLVPATGLPPPSGIEPFGQELPRELIQPELNPSVADEVQLGLTQDHQDPTLPHDNSGLDDITSNTVDIHLDENMETLFGDIVVSPRESGFPSQLELPPGATESLDHNDAFQTSLEELAVATNNPSTENVGMAENVEYRGSAVVVEGTLQIEDSLESKNFGGNVVDLELDAAFEHTDFASLSAGIFEPQTSSQFEEGIGDLDLQSMADLFVGEIGSSLNTDALSK
jgi:hypothetical protein